MSRNGSGVYSLPAGNPVVTGTTISSSWANTTLSDIATALTGSVAADGQTAMTGNLQMGNNKITGLAVATSSGDALSYGQAATISALTVTGAFAANGGATLGDASGDALTINSSAVSIPNGLNFDSNTLVIDATNNRVGVGGSPASSLDVASGNFIVRSGNITGYDNVIVTANAVNTNGTVVDINSAGTVGVIKLSTVNTERMRIDSTGNLSIGATGFTNVRLLTKGTNTASDTYAFLARNSADTDLFAITNAGNVGIGTSSPSYKLDVSGQSNLNGIRIGLNGDTINASGNLLTFQGAGTERMRIDSSGNLLVGTTSAGGVGWSLYGTGNLGYGVTKRSGTGSQAHISFQNDNGQVGYILTSGSSTTYSTSSDYRLKDNIAPMAGALDTVAALKPVTYTWKADGSDGQGFIAHELQEVVPDCVTGEKDAVDAEGNPQYQGIDTSFLVATLTAAIQEQQAIITDLKARIETLENK